jgi:4-diphosphocytidyl-2-C-methyl-D-erythritol kinase
MALQVFAPAKVNLHLAVGARRSDGYHDVTTVLQALDFGDTVTIAPAAEFGFACLPDLGLSPDDNLACRAAQALAARFDRPLDVSIVVSKRIPAGAGLGGASSDAAAVLLGLARLWAVDTADEALLDVARTLGADVPFFLGACTALYSGRGDVLERMLPPLDAPIVLAKPGAPVPTAQAYAAFDRLPQVPSPDPSALLAELEGGDASEVAARLYNNMTHAALLLVPALGEALRLVGESPGVLAALMAGSGSAVFGICADDSAAAACADAARSVGLWAVATRAHTGRCR